MLANHPNAGTLMEIMMLKGKVPYVRIIDYNIALEQYTRYRGKPNFKLWSLLIAGFSFIYYERICFHEYDIS